MWFLSWQPELCNYSSKTAINKTKIHKRRTVCPCSSKTSFTKKKKEKKKKAALWIWTKDSSLPTPVLKTWESLKSKNSKKSGAASVWLSTFSQVPNLGPDKTQYVLLNSEFTEWRTVLKDIYSVVKDQKSFLSRAGPTCIVTGSKAMSYKNEDEKLELQIQPVEICGGTRGVFWQLCKNIK